MCEPTSSNLLSLSVYKRFFFFFNPSVCSGPFQRYMKVGGVNVLLEDLMLSKVVSLLSKPLSLRFLKPSLFKVTLGSRKS